MRTHTIGILAVILLSIPTIVKLMAVCYGLSFNIDDYMWLMLAGTCCGIMYVNGIDDEDEQDLITLRSNADEDRPE